MTTKIEWADETWNPVTGCNKISEGCQNCYAERMAKRLAGRCGYDSEEPFKVTLHEDKLDEPLKWRKPRRVFVCSMGDLFHEDVNPLDIGRIINVIRECTQHTFLILTKRPQKMKKVLESYYETLMDGGEKPILNLWLGVTAENQQRAEERIPILLQTPAIVRFVSVEPMLGPINLFEERLSWCQICGTLFDDPEDLKCCPKCGDDYILRRHSFADHLDWVICGGETGQKARPMHPNWVRGLRDQCQQAGVPFFFKQWGEWYPDNKGIYEGADCAFFGNTVVHRIGKKASGYLLDGQEWREFPKTGRNEQC